VRILKNLFKFFGDDIPYFAASLSFFTIFSLLPIVALIIVIMSSTSYFEGYIDLIMLYIFDFINPTHSQTITNNINHFMTNINELGNLGIFYLLFVFTIFFKDYEYIVNRIHNSPKLNFISMIMLYITFLILVPFIIVVFTLLSSFIVLNVYTIILHSFIALLVLTILFKISANTSVSIKAAFISAFVTLGALKLTKALFSYYIALNTTYATIYGTMSVLLFGLLWVYISWMVYLYGIKLCYLLNQRYKNHEN